MVDLVAMAYNIIKNIMWAEEELAEGDKENANTYFLKASMIADDLSQEILARVRG